jgi:glutaredoxin
MRSFAIAAVMTALVSGVGYSLAPAPRDPAAAPKNAVAVIDELAGPGAAVADDGSGEATPSDAPAVAPAASKRTFYQWTDERGTVRFARSLEEVPAGWRERAGQIEVDTTAYAAKPRATAAPARKPYSDVQVGASRFADVTVYTAPWCGWCRKTLAWLDERDVDYTNKNIEESEEFAAELVQKSGSRSIPFVEIDGTQIRGYNPNEMAALLE